MLNEVREACPRQRLIVEVAVSRRLAAQAVKAWRFTPAVQDGAALAVMLDVKLRFDAPKHTPTGGGFDGA